MTTDTLNITISASISSTTFTSTSDDRIKKNVLLLDHSFNVNRLRPASYVNTVSENQDIGLIAHELREQNINIQTIDYIGIIGILINEINNLKDKVCKLEK